MKSGVILRCRSITGFAEVVTTPVKGFCTEIRGTRMCYVIKVNW